MKARMKTVLCGSATVFAFTVLSSTVVFAAPSTDSNNIEDSVWSYRAVADVDTQVNIRANASTKSEIVGYLPKGASADLIEKGEKWSHIISNGVEGYIKNDYLAYGEDAEYLANVYGTQGVKVNWDGVNLFSSPDAAADILDSADNGSEYSLISEDGDWYQVQMDDVTVAYVPAEDAEEMIITDRAVAISTADVNVSDADANTDTTDSVAQGYYDPNGWGWNAAGYGTADTDSTYNDDSYSADGAYDDTSADSIYADNSYNADSTYTGDAYNTGDSYTDDSYTDGTYAGETYESDSTYGTDGSYTDNSYSEDTTADASYDTADDTYDSAASTGSEETVTTADSSDLNLLAAIIYCEAGNQSREGKVAVGAVVLNRVASASFPNSISEVVYQAGQFTPAYSGALASALASGVPSDCVEAAQAALNGENPVGGALYFNTGSGTGVKIGAHQFY
jgi:spore germination cell wall hydrolase CwlJ-like protein/SH3-like domain-containing protein